MARNKTLLSILQDYRSEIRASGNPAHNSGVRDTQVRRIQRVQEWLWEDYDWAHLRVERRLHIQAGQRLYDPPADIALDRVESVEVRYGQQWVPLPYGIGPDEHSVYDPYLDERSWPVERWELYEDEQIELWPVPADDADAATLEGVLRFTGIRSLRPLVKDTDRADLDDRLIVLFAAAEELAAQGSKDADLKLQLAQKRLATLKGNNSKVQKFTLFGGGNSRGRVLRGPPRVHYRDRETG